MAWSLLCSSPKCVDIPAWGSRRQKEDLPSASTTAPHVPCSPSPVPVMPGPRGWMPMLGPAPPHTDPLGEACRAVSAVPRWLPWAHTGVTQACVEPGPLTTGHFEPGAGKKEPVFLELPLVPCPPGAASEPACQQSPLFICAARRAWGGPPRSPFIQEKRARGARPACPRACGQGSGLHSRSPKGTSELPSGPGDGLPGINPRSARSGLLKP